MTLPSKPSINSFKEQMDKLQEELLQPDWMSSKTNECISTSYDKEQAKEPDWFLYDDSNDIGISEEFQFRFSSEMDAIHSSMLGSNRKMDNTREMLLTKMATIPILMWLLYSFYGRGRKKAKEDPIVSRKEAEESVEPLALKGPKGPQTLSYIVATPSPEQVTVFNLPKTNSVYRQLVLDTKHFTLEQKVSPTNSNTDSSTSTVPKHHEKNENNESIGSMMDGQNNDDDDQKQDPLSFPISPSPTAESQFESEQSKKSCLSLIHLSDILNISIPSNNNLGSKDSQYKHCVGTLELTIATTNITTASLTDNTSRYVHGNMSNTYDDFTTAEQQHQQRSPLEGGEGPTNVLDDVSTKTNLGRKSYDIASNHNDTADGDGINRVPNPNENNKNWPLGRENETIPHLQANNISLAGDGDSDGLTNNAEISSEQTITNQENDNSKKHLRDITVGTEIANIATTNTTKMEYTFASTSEAASFQNVVLMLKFVGEEVWNMYIALETATRNKNIIDKKTSQDIGGVALDDVKNCLGELTFIQCTLARYYRYHYPSQSGTGSGATAARGVDRGEDECNNLTASAADQYESNQKQKRQKKEGGQEKVKDLNEDCSIRGADKNFTTTTMFENSRLLMGFIDFLQLFIPITLPDDAIPYATPTTARTKGSSVDEDEDKYDITSHRATNSVHDDNYCRPSNSDSSSSKSDNCGEDEDGIKAHQERVIKLVELRKRVAHASVRVRSYVNAMMVVHQGWRLDNGTSSGEMEDSTVVGGNDGDSSQNNKMKVKDNLADDKSKGLKRRFTFDSDESNMLYDDVAANEYYETFFRNNGQRDTTWCNSTIAIGSNIYFYPYHAFSLVGCHAFDLSTVESYSSDGSNKGNCSLEPWLDPVASIPSLSRIIKQNDHLEFFVWAVFIEGGRQGRWQGKEDRILKVVLFVRNLPTFGSANEKFDCAYDSFKSGDLDYRDQKLKLFLQLCPSPSLSPVSLAAAKVVSFFLKFDKCSKIQIPFTNSIGSCASASLPGIPLSRFSTSRHFGGSLQTNKTLPNNYIAVTSRIDASSMTSFPARMIYTRFWGKESCSNVIDFTLVVEGDKEEEKMDRFLGSIRIVHYDFSAILPPSLIVRKKEGQTDVFCSLCENQESNETEQGTQSFSNSDEGHGDTNDVEDESDNEAESPIKSGIASLKFILRGVTVPVRKCNLANMTAGDEIDDASSLILRGPNSIWKEDMIDFSVLQSLSDSDLERFYVAADLNLEKAAVRIIQSVAWRGITFPIDTMACRTELQSGQFFRQGVDLEKNPVFYFRNICLGPRRKDTESVIFAALHRFESAAQELNKHDEKFKCTLIIIWKPIGDITEDVLNTPGEEAKDKKEEKPVEERNLFKKMKAYQNKRVNDSRVDPKEDYRLHTHFSLVRRLQDIFSKHYPERLSKVLIVSSGGWEKTLGTVGLRAYVPASRTRSRVVMLNRPDDLKKYVSKDELVTLVGGNAVVRSEAFEI